MTDAGAASGTRPEWPAILDRYVREVGRDDPEHQPRRTRRRYHGREVPVWYGRVHIDDVGGWVENIRLKHFLHRWRVRRGDLTATPTTQEIYEIMIEADREERGESNRPFNLERLARNIGANGIQEPIFVHVDSRGRGTLWDGNRRRYATHHIMVDGAFSAFRTQAQWLPAYVHTPSGDPEADSAIKHAVLTELNFKDKDHIPWPTYVKAGEVFDLYERLTAEDPSDPTLRRLAKQQVAEEYGLSGWRTADRWVRMYNLAREYKEYQETEHHHPEPEVELRIQDDFEYFDELTKPGVWGAIRDDVDKRDEVFQWLWDRKFKAFADVRSVPKIMADPEARRQANQGDTDAVKRAIATVIANDPARIRDKSAANERIAHFAAWLDSFRREDYRQLTPESLELLRQILRDVVRIVNSLQDEDEAAEEDDTSEEAGDER